MFDFQDKKIVVMGLGLNGGGLSVAKWFFSQGAEVIVTDLKNKESLQTSIEKLDVFCRQYRLAHHQNKFHSIEYVLGAHRESDFSTADLVVRNPGVPDNSIFLKIAYDNQVPVENEASLFFLLTPKTPKIGITGTRGKSTTTTLIYDILKQHNSEILFCGNIRTVAFFDIIDKVIQREAQGKFIPVVIELSSWQLELLSPHELSPEIAVVTNVMADHLNRYGNIEEYAKAKALIFKYQKPGDSVVLNSENSYTFLMGQQGTIKSDKYWFSDRNILEANGCFIAGEDLANKKIKAKEKKYIYFQKDGKTQKILEVDNIRLAGEHNLQNILAACTVAKIMKVSNAIIAKVVSSFEGIPDRQEFLGEYKGVKIYNDTTSTMPDATIAAIKTFGGKGKKRLVLIAGGADKNLDFKDLAPLVKDRVKAIVLLSGTATPKLAQSLSQVGYDGVVEMANSLIEGVQKGFKNCRKNDILLLSPACASFGMFINEFDRGEQFKKIISEYLKNQN